MIFTYGEKYDTWRFHGVVSWEQYSAVINATIEFGIGWTSDCEMPLEEIVLNFETILLDWIFDRLPGKQNKGAPSRIDSKKHGNKKSAIV
ncbi:unnamed protein product [Gongylonema pulchrum]|uniref:Uncharacterized protein n=1 Tax=Gongylonema pulchrum TaxID=637853 RepID=A0A183E4E0_9BILA|nr:unnamed protein product [Gongylonema pulchrum]